MGGAAAASSARVRIKGRKLSVVRFLIISVRGSARVLFGCAAAVVRIGVW